MDGLDLSKAQKKIARELIETGLEREFEKGIGKIDRIIQHWKDGKLEIKETYYEVFKSLNTFDKHIARRYDDMKGSTYLYILAGQLADGIISIDDMNGFDQDVKDKIIFISSINED